MWGRPEQRSCFPGYAAAFVLGFACCGYVARFVLPTPVSAASAGAISASNAADVVERISPSVVSVELYPAGRTSTPPWARLFGNSAEDDDPDSVASGVIVSSGGYIVTNCHVVEGESRIRIRLASGREYEGRVAGCDSHSDLALIKIEAHGLEPARFGDSRHLRPGEPVIAIGNPLGFENSVSLGIVSANRPGPIRVDGHTLGDTIQTDASINQGNSGGGLFTMDGRLVGINSAIMVPHGGAGSIGIGFAIPVHRVRPVIDTLMESGRVPRPWLGIRYTPSRSGSLIRRVRKGFGVLVEQVLPDSPAASAGLQPADILQGIGAVRIRSADDLYSFKDQNQPNTHNNTRVLRGGHPKTLVLTL